MVNPQIHGVKRGVLLLNNRVVVPGSLPGVSRVDQVAVTPVLRSVSWEGDYWRYAGVLQVQVTYGAAMRETNPEGMKTWDPDGSLSVYGEKNFYDDGFSDHDEFAEEEFILLEEGPAPEQLGFSLQIQSLEQTVEFAGLSPAVSAGLPEADCLISRVIDVEVKVRDERVLDMSVVLVLEEEDSSQIRGVPGGSVVEFRHPLSMSSWPPGMAEVLEWQAGFKAGELVFRDNEVLVNGELVIQVIGVEKEGGEREFSNVTTQSPVFWAIPLPPGTDRSLLSGVKVAISRVQEDSAGLAVFGAIHLDIAEGSILLDRPEETLVPPVEVEDVPMPAGYPEEVLMLPEEPTLPVFADIAAQDCNLGWLKDWADGQCIEPGDRNELFEGDYAVPAGVAEGEQVSEPEGLHSEDIDPDSEELLRSLDDGFSLNRRIAEARYNLTYGVQPKAKTRLPENSEPVRKSLTQLKFISREALQGEARPPAINKVSALGKTQPQTAERQLSPQKPLGRTVSAQVRRVIEKNSGSKPTGTWTLYLVKSGDSLGEICRRYGIDSEIVRERNQLSGNSLEPGSTIWIPK